MESVWTLLRITLLVHWKSYLIIICPNSHDKFTKSEIRSSWSRFKHCSESLVQPIGSHIWSLFAPIYMTSLPKVKLCWSRFEHFSESLIQPIGSYIWPLLAPIHMKSWPNMKLGKVIICSNLVWSTLTWLLNTMFVHIKHYLPTFTTIYLYLAKCSINYTYLVIFALNYPDLSICAIFTPARYSSIENAPLCKI